MCHPARVLRPSGLTLGCSPVPFLWVLDTWYPWYQISSAAPECLASELPSNVLDLPVLAKLPSALSDLRLTHWVLLGFGWVPNDSDRVSSSFLKTQIGVAPDSHTKYLQELIQESNLAVQMSSPFLIQRFMIRIHTKNFFLLLLLYSGFHWVNPLMLRDLWCGNFTIWGKICLLAHESRLDSSNHCTPLSNSAFKRGLDQELNPCILHCHFSLSLSVLTAISFPRHGCLTPTFVPTISRRRRWYP
jgi:hypothetical protein